MMETKQYIYEIVHINDLDFDHYLSLIKKGYCIFDVKDEVVSYLCSEFDYYYQKYKDYDALYEYACLLKQKDKDNEESAWKYFQAMFHLAQHKYVKAYYSLGMCFYNGYGVIKDIKQAYENFVKGEIEGYVPATNALAALYYKGEYVEQDKEKSFIMMKSCADQGYAIAMHNVALSYLHGEGVNKDINECLRYYKLAASQDFAKSHYHLGYMYLYGDEVPQDYDEGFYHLYKAALLGNEDARDLIKQIGNQSQLDYKNKYWYQIDEDIYRD